MSQGFQLEFLSYVRRSSSIAYEPESTKEAVFPSGNRQSEKPATRQNTRTSTPIHEQHAAGSSSERSSRRSSYSASSTVSVQVYSAGDAVAGNTVWHKVTPGSSIGTQSDGTRTRSMRSRMKDLDIEELAKTSTKTQLVIMEDEDDTEIMIEKKFPSPTIKANGAAPENGSTDPPPALSHNGANETKKDKKATDKKGPKPDGNDASDSEGQERKDQNETVATSRPKRQIVPKNLDHHSGLSWKEQNDLKKALYLSLHETKRPEVKPLSNGEEKKSIGRSKSMSVLDESSQDSTRSAVSSENSQEQKDFVFRGRVRAQRKFAQGSRPCSPQVSPVKAPKPTPRKFFTTKKAKTEDFLTFLCLRGSHVLPPHLDFYNMHDSDDPSCPGTPRQSVSGSRPGTPGLGPLSGTNTPSRAKTQLIMPSPSRSKASSPDRELNLENNDLGVRPLPQEDTTSPRKKIVQHETSIKNGTKASLSYRKRPSSSHVETVCPIEAIVTNDVELTPTKKRRAQADLELPAIMDFPTSLELTPPKKLELFPKCRLVPKTKHKHKHSSSKLSSKSKLKKKKVPTATLR